MRPFALALGALVLCACQRQAETAATVSSSADCASCHAAVFAAWQGSHHALAERKLAPGELTVRDLGPDGAWHDYPAQRAIGVAPLVQYVVELDGQLQVSQQARATADGGFFDVFADGRQPGEWGHWTGRGMNWDSMCAVCHNTGVTRQWSAEKDQFTTTVQEHGVGCAACHGDASAHAADPARGGEALLATATAADTCLPCHARRTELSMPQPGAPFLDVAIPAMPDLSEHFYPDGQIHAEDFEASSFLMSKMSAAGVTCLDCHEPHGGKLRQTGNDLCMQCHDGQGRLPAPLITPATHSGHAVDSPGAACIACHMPTTVYMQKHARHDHGFHLPDPRLSRELELPLACDRCHGDEQKTWAQEVVEARPTWKGNPDTRRRARAVQAARQGSATAADALRHALEAESHPRWRGILLGLLATLGEAADRPRFDDAASSANPWERLATWPTPALLEDPFRAIRHRAAQAFDRDLPLDHQAMQEYLATLNLQAGQPTAAMAMAQFLFRRGEAAAALPWTTWAERWEGSSSAPLHLRAAALDALGRQDEAYALMQECCRRFPAEAQGFYLLGLAASAVGEYQAGIEALKQALQLQPGFPAAKRNLARLEAFLRQTQSDAMVNPQPSPR